MLFQILSNLSAICSGIVVPEALGNQLCSLSGGANNISS